MTRKPGHTFPGRIKLQVLNRGGEGLLSQNRPERGLPSALDANAIETGIVDYNLLGTTEIRDGPVRKQLTRCLIGVEGSSADGGRRKPKGASGQLANRLVRGGGKLPEQELGPGEQRQIDFANGDEERERRSDGGGQNRYLSSGERRKEKRSLLSGSKNRNSRGRANKSVAKNQFL